MFCKFSSDRGYLY